MVRNLLIFTAAVLIMLFSSCGQAQLYLQVLNGNYEYSRGDYKESNFTYIQALEHALYTERIAYNLGNIYHSLGETDAALEEWSRASTEQDDSILIARIAFNRGVLYYELGNYQEAYSEFRKVLSIDPDDVEAKANLEYCLRKLNLGQRPQEMKQESDEGGEEQQLSEDGKRILEYVRRSATTTLTPDYEVEEEEYTKNW